MRTVKQYKEVAELVANLIIATEHDDMKWEDLGPISVFKAIHKGITYLVDNPQDGHLELIVDEVLVLSGDQLRALIGVIWEQNKRLYPRNYLPPATTLPLPDQEVFETLDRALKTFKK